MDSERIVHEHERSVQACRQASEVYQLARRRSSSTWWVCLFAALNVLTGVVIGRCLPRHRNTEFLKFLRIIDREVPKGLQIHLISDNYGTHQLTSTPTSKRDKAIRWGVFHRVNDLITAIEDYLTDESLSSK